MYLYGFVSFYKCYNEIVIRKMNLSLLSNSLDEKIRIKIMVMRVKFDKYWESLKDINKLLFVLVFLIRGIK